MGADEVTRSPIAESGIIIHVNRRWEALSAAFFGVFAAVGVEGLVTDTRIVASVVLLVAFGPLFMLALRRVARRGPVLVLGKEAVIDPRRGVTIRWENIDDARVTEIRGAFSTYHKLHLSGALHSGETTPLDGNDTIDFAMLDRLSLPSGQIIEEIERRLPATTILHRAHRLTAKSTVSR